MTGEKGSPSPEPTSPAETNASPIGKGQIPAFLPLEVFRTLLEPDGKPVGTVADKVTNALWGFREAIERKESRTDLFTNQEPTDEPSLQGVSSPRRPEPKDPDPGQATISQAQPPHGSIPGKEEKVETPGPDSVEVASPDESSPPAPGSGREPNPVRSIFQTSAKPNDERKSRFGDDEINGGSDPITPFGESATENAQPASPFSEPTRLAGDQAPSMFVPPPETSSTPSPFGMGDPVTGIQEDSPRVEESEDATPLFGQNQEEAPPTEVVLGETASEPKAEEPTPSKEPIPSGTKHNPFHSPKPLPVGDPAPETGDESATTGESRADSSRTSLFSDEKPVEARLQSRPFAESKPDPVEPKPISFKKAPSSETPRRLPSIPLP